MSAITASGLCQCGCGEATRLAPRTDLAKGWVRGQPLRYVLGHRTHRRLLASYAVNPEAGCWMWLGYLIHGGYGYVKGRGYAHRLIFEALRGPIPAGLQLDHLCHSRDLLCKGGVLCPHRRCVNPEHLEPVTNLENQRRGVRARQTHCIYGHPFDEANTYVAPRGRACRECHRIRTAVRRQKARAAA